MKTSHPLDFCAFNEVVSLLEKHGAKNILKNKLLAEQIRNKPKCISRRILYKEDYFLAIIDRLSEKEWLHFLKNRSDIAPLIEWINRLLWRRDHLTEKTAWKLEQGLCVRRIIQIFVSKGICDIDYICGEFANGPKRLPGGWGSPDAIRYRTVSDKNFSDFIDSAKKIWDKKTWHDINYDKEALKRIVDFEGEPIYLSQFRWNRYGRYTRLNRTYKVNDSQRIFASTLISGLSVSQSIQFEDQVLEWILTIMICYGIELDLALDLSLIPDDLSPGYVDGQGIHLNLGNKRYEKSSEIYDKSIISFRWNPIARSYYDLIDVKKGSSKKLIDLFKKYSLKHFNEYFKKRWKDQFNDRELGKVIRGLSEVYRSVGIIDHQISLAELSILRGTPIHPHRGLCSYTGIPQSRIDQIHSKIQSTIFKEAGIDDQNDFEPSPDPALHGSSYHNLKLNAKKLTRLIESVSSDNEINYLFVCMLRMLGLRYTDSHPHPRAVIIDYPFPCFAFQDKQIAFRRPLRIIPFESLARLFQSPEGFNPYLEIAYSENGKEVCWEDLSAKMKLNLKRLFYELEDSIHHLRRSYINYLRELGLGEIPLTSQTGHSVAEFQIGGINSLIAPIDHWNEMNLFWEKISSQLGFNKIAERLLERAHELGGLKSILIQKEDWKKKAVKFTNEKSSARQDIGMMLPRETQNRCFTLFKNEFYKAQRIDPALGLICLLTLEHHIPLRYWIEYKDYLTLNSFFKTSENLYLRIVIDQEDAGGIGAIPLCLGKIDSEKNQKILRLYEKLKTRALRISKGKDISKWNLFFETEFKRETIEELLLLLIYREDPKFLIPKKYVLPEIDRVLEFRLFVNHPGIFAAALIRSNVFQLNETSLQDVVGLMENRSVSLMTPEGIAYQEDLLLSVHGLKLRSRLYGSIRKLPKDYPKDKIYEFIRTHGRGISHSRLSELLPHFNLSHKPRKARRLSRDFLKQLRKDGKCVRTKSFPILSPQELEVLVEGVVEKIQSEELSESIKKGLITYLLIGICTGARIGEICRLHWLDFNISRDQIKITITEGKSANAARMINLKMFQWNASYLARLQLLFPDFNKYPSYVWDSRELSKKKTSRRWKKRSGRLNKSNEEAVAKKLSNYIKEIAREKLQRNSEHLSFHTLRHLYAYHGVQEILAKHYWHGNYYSVMATFAAQMGHASFIFTQSSYLGTGCLGLKLPPLVLPDPTESYPSNLATPTQYIAT